MRKNNYRLQFTQVNKWLAVLFFVFGLLATNANAQVFCIGANSAGTISGYTATYQPTASVAAGSAWYWTTTLVPGVTYQWSNCTTEGGTPSDVYMRIYNSSNTIVASGDDNCGVQPNVTYTPTVGGTYYVVLTQYSCGVLSTSQIISYKATGLPPAFCGTASYAGNISGYTSTFQTAPGVAAGAMYYWPTNLTVGPTYTWSNCTTEGGTSEDTYLRLYNSAGTIVASGDDICGVNAKISYTPTVGGTYFVVMSHYSCVNLVSNQLLAYKSVVPTGCPAGLGTGVVNISSLPYTVSGATTCGMVDDLTASNTTICNSSLYYGTEDVVYIFTPSVTGTYGVDITSNSSYVGIMLYAGCPLLGQGGTCVGYAQSSSSAQNITTTLNAGTTYYLVVDQWPSPYCIPSYNLTIGQVVPYDACTNIQPLTCGVSNFTVVDPGNGSINFAGWQPGKERIYSYTAPTTGIYTVTKSTYDSWFYYTDFYFKAASGGCNGTGWNYIAYLYTGTSAPFSMTAGTTYYFLVEEETYTSGGSITWTLDCAQIPYDPCANIQPTAACGTTNTTVIDPGNGSYALGPYAPPSKERIYTFTPASTSIFNITISSNSYGYYTDLFYKDASTGCNNSGWTFINDVYGNATSAGFTLTGGVTYYIMLDEEYYTGGGTIQWSISCPAVYVPPPPNDECYGAVAQTIACGQTATFSGTTAGATTTGGDGAFTSYPVVWEKLILTNMAATLDISYCGNTPGRFGNVYINMVTDCPGFTGFFNSGYDQSTCADGFWTIHFFNVPAGTYYIPVMGTSNVAGYMNTPGPYTIQVVTTCPAPPPANDDCAGAIAIPCGGSVTGNNGGALDDFSAPDCAGFNVGYYKGMWYSITPTVNSYVNLSLCSGATWDTYIKVYSGTCGSLTCVAYNDDNCGLQSNLTTPALTGGQTYYILVTGYSSSAFGAFTLSTTCTPSDCQGQPNPGLTLSNVSNPVCGQFTLSLQNSTPGGNITYQWESSLNGSSWTPISGATNATLTTGQSGDTYYHCVVTCPSNTPGVSTAYQVISNPNFMDCYCVPVTYCGYPDIITNVTFAGINRSSLCDDAINAHSTYTSPNPVVLMAVPNSISVSTGGDVEGIAVWIDYNHSGSFDANEAVLNGYAGTNPATYTGTVTIPTTAQPGQTMMRVRCHYAGDALSFGPCANYSYGETEDYWLQIIPPNAISNSPVCEGQSIILDAPTTGTAYSWTGPNGFTSTIKNPTITLADPNTMGGTYTVVVTTVSGSYTATVDVVVNPAPALSASAPAAFCELTQDLNLSSTAPTATQWSWTGPLGFTSSQEDPILTPSDHTMTGDYKVVVTDANGCRDSSIVTATVYELPNITLTVQAATPHLCTGQSITLIAENIGSGGFNIGGADYVWTTGETTDFIVITSGGSYTVTGTDGNGCVNTDNTTISESAPPPAPVIVALGDINICSSDGGSNFTGVVLHTQNYSSSLTWNTGLDYTQDVFANYPYDFNVTYRDLFGCESTSNTISTIPNLASVAPIDAQVSSNAPGNITCAVPVTLTLAAQTADPLAAGYLGDNAQWKWYLDGGSCGAGTLVGTGASITVTPPAAPGPHTYYVRAEGLCNTTNCASIVITVKDPSTDPTSASASVSTICAGDPTQLSVSGGSLGTGAQWKWYSGSCGGTLAGIGATINVNPTSTTTYFVRAEGDCNMSACRSVTVTVSTPSTAPTSATSNAPVNGICLGGPVTLTVSGGTLGTNSVYTWYEDGCGNGAAVGTGSSITIIPAIEGLHSYYVRAEGPCNTTTCVGVQVLVGTYSVEASSITSSVVGNSICTGNNITLTVNGGFLGTVAQWKWYSGSCGGTAAGTGTSITVNPAATTNYFVRAEGSCNNTLCANAIVSVSTVAPTSPPPTITTAPNGICSGNGSTVACNAVAGATFYSWSAPNGTTFDGNNPSPYITTSNSVQVTFGNLPNGVSGYDICVFAGNGCGNTVTKCRYIRGRVQTAQTITGNASSCPNTTSPYSIVSLPGADSYTWTVTGAATINGGGSTYTGTATTVNVNFLAGWTSGTLSVYGSMNCGYNGPTKTITIISTPVVPGVISGPALVCPNLTYSYSIAPVAGATGYNWSTNVPGAIIGAGTTTKSITFPSVIPAGSVVQVTATGSCGTSLPRTKNIATGLANAPGTISGVTTGQCGQTGVNYSILPVAGATSYLWTASNGASVNGLNNITTAVIDFPAIFTNSTVSVVAINGCGNSAPTNLVVNAAPANPGVITGPGAVCVGTQAYNYSVLGTVGASQYQWSAPVNTLILSGQGTPGVSILYTDNTSGNVSVYAQNACGVSSSSSVAVQTVCRQAQLIQGSLIDATLYPNPTVGTTTLRLETLSAGDYKVSVVDMTGQVMETSTITAVEGVNMHEFDMSTYAKGLYMVRLERAGEAMQMLRVTVE